MSELNECKRCGCPCKGEYCNECNYRMSEESDLEEEDEN